jgi:hypothetical protein
MNQNLPATRSEETGLATTGASELHADHRDPQQQQVQQNVSTGLLPLALIILLIVAFVAAAWTFLAAQPAV